MMNGQQVWIDDVSRSARPNARRQASPSYSTACTAVFHSKQICAACVANSLSCQPRSGNWTLKRCWRVRCLPVPLNRRDRAGARRRA
jgi:hypothetical protein